MRFVRHVLASVFAALAAVPNATAQSSSTSPAFVPHGNYTMAPDSGYAGPDLTGIVLHFTDDSTLVVNNADGSLVVKARVTYDAGTISLNDLEGDSMCPTVGKYKLTGDEKAFRMVLVIDGCTDRATIVTMVRFVKAEA